MKLKLAEMLRMYQVHVSIVSSNQFVIAENREIAHSYYRIDQHYLLNYPRIHSTKYPEKQKNRVDFIRKIDLHSIDFLLYSLLN